LLGHPPKKHKPIDLAGHSIALVNRILTDGKGHPLHLIDIEKSAEVVPCRF
jgi:hypothetical protein